MLKMVGKIVDGRKVIGYTVSNGKETKNLKISEVLNLAQNNQIVDVKYLKSRDSITGCNGFELKKLPSKQLKDSASPKNIGVSDKSKKTVPPKVKKSVYTLNNPHQTRTYKPDRDVVVVNKDGAYYGAFSTELIDDNDFQKKSVCNVDVGAFVINNYLITKADIIDGREMRKGSNLPFMSVIDLETHKKVNISAKDFLSVLHNKRAYKSMIGDTNCIVGNKLYLFFFELVGTRKNKLDLIVVSVNLTNGSVTKEFNIDIDKLGWGRYTYRLFNLDSERCIIIVNSVDGSTTYYEKLIVFNYATSKYGVADFKGDGPLLVIEYNRFLYKPHDISTSIDGDTLRLHIKLPELYEDRGSREHSFTVKNI